MGEVINLKEFTIVPPDYKLRDPRQTAYNFADRIRNTERGLIIYNKQVSEFLYYYALDAAQQACKNCGQLLVPTDCLNWRKSKEYAHRRLYIGRRAFYQMFPKELTRRELSKLMDFAEEVMVR